MAGAQSRGELGPLQVVKHVGLFPKSAEKAVEGSPWGRGQGGGDGRESASAEPGDAEEAGQERRWGKVHGGRPVSHGVTATGNGWGAAEKPTDLRSILVPGCLEGCGERQTTFPFRPHDSGFKTVTNFSNLRLDFLTK